MAGAFVRIKGRSPDATTDQSGRVTLEGLPLGQTMAEIGAIGYEMRKEPLFVKEGPVEQRVVVVDGGIRVATTVQASLAADHRASDGHRGALFLAEINRLLQQPQDL